MLNNSRINFKAFRNLATSVLFIVSIAFLFFYIFGQWSKLESYVSQLNWTDIGLASLSFTFALGLLPINSWLLLRWLNANMSPIKLWYLFYLSQIAKYLPGSIWALPGRVYLYKNDGVSVSTATAAVVWEVVTMVQGAALLALLSMPLLRDTPLAFLAIVGINILFAIILVCGIVIKSAPKLERMPKVIYQTLVAVLGRLTWYQVVILVILYMLNWLAIGLAFTHLVAVIQWSEFIATPLSLSGLFAGAWALGFLIIIAPGGIGVRDGFIVLGLSSIMLEPFPFIITILARLLWTIAEFVGVIITSLLHLFTRNRAGNVMAKPAIHDHHSNPLN